MLDMLGTKETRNQLRGIAHMLEVIRSYGVSRRKRGLHVLPMKLITKLWLKILVRWYDYNIFSRTCEL